MQQMNTSGRRALEQLYVILDAGERGYAMASANVNNRAFKMLFKLHARQRAGFKQQLYEAVGKNIAKSRPLVQLLAIIHRGPINILAELTIGEQNRERVMLKEVLVGERAALKAYERAFRKRLPADTMRMVQAQYQHVQQVVAHVRLFDSQRDVKRAIQRLKQANFDPAAIAWPR